MTPETPTPPAKPRRWLMPALLVSVGLNLLIVGLVAGTLLSPEGPADREARTIRSIVGEPFFRALPRDERRAMLHDIFRNRAEFSGYREGLQDRIDALLAALRADTFDRTAVEALLAEQRSTTLTRLDLGEDLLLDRVDNMTLETRRAYADALEERLKALTRR